MPDDTHESAEFIAEPTEAQFSIRALFATMAVVAVLAAIAGAIVRRVELEIRVRLLSAWALWLLASVVWIAYAAHRRHAAEQLAGRALLRVPLFDERVPDVSAARRRRNIAFGVFLELIMLAGFTFGVADIRPGSISPGELFHSVMIGMVCVYWTSRLATSFWWRNNVRFGEFGVLWDRRVMLWDHIVLCDYKETASSQLQISGIDQNNVDMHLTVVVPLELRDALDEILQSKFVAKPEVDIKPPLAASSTMPLSVAVRDSRFLKYMALIVFVVVVFGILGGTLFLGGITGVREFDQSIFVGFIGTSLAVALLRTLTQRTRGVSIGPPLVRVSKSRDWVLALGLVGVAGGLYWIGKRFGVTSALVSYVSGFAFGGIASSVIRSLVEHPVDLRENGVYRFGIYWPWDELRLVEWQPESGKLVLRRGWRTLRANVAVEQRELVGCVLREKLLH